MSDAMRPAATTLERTFDVGAEARDDLRQRDQSGLRGRVVRRARSAILAADRADMDDAAAAGLRQQRQEDLRADERAFQIGVEDRVPIRVGDLVEIGRLVDAGIVHEDRDLAEACAPRAPPLRRWRGR